MQPACRKEIYTVARDIFTEYPLLPMVYPWQELDSRCIAQRYDQPNASGSTRRSTRRLTARSATRNSEAITPGGAQPFSLYRDLCC
jgi:hypothetical protein